MPDSFTGMTGTGCREQLSPCAAAGTASCPAGLCLTHQTWGVPGALALCDRDLPSLLQLFAMLSDALPCSLRTLRVLFWLQ